MYSISRDHTVTEGECLIAIVSDGVVLPEIVHIQIGPMAPPADENYVFGVYEISDIGSGGTVVTPKRVGLVQAAASLCKYGSFSSEPTKEGSRMVALKCHRRAESLFVKPPGDGLRPAAFAANKGLAIFADEAPSSIVVSISVLFREGN